MENAKEQFLSYLTQEINNPNSDVSNSVMKELKRLFKSINKMSTLEYIQYMAVLEFFIADQQQKLIAQFNNTDQENKIEVNNMTEDEKIQSFMNQLDNVAKELGLDFYAGFAEVDPVTGEPITISDAPISQYKYNTSNDEAVSYIERRPLMIYFSDNGFKINESFMTYLKEINANGARNSFMMVPYAYNEDDDDEDEEPDLRLTIGTKDNNLIVTLTGGVSKYESFEIYEMDDGCGKMYGKDLKYLRSKIDKSMRGLWLFKLDKSSHYFIGEKIEREFTISE